MEQMESMGRLSGCSPQDRCMSRFAHSKRLQHWYPVAPRERPADSHRQREQADVPPRACVRPKRLKQYL
eukprot:3752422-Rhodomonas_salina.1